VITLNDIVHAPSITPWIDRILAHPNGVVVVGGLAGEGTGSILAILARQMLAARRRGAPAWVVGREDFIRLPVDGTGMPDIGNECAISRSSNRIGRILEDLA
jgi:hypothetical protein